MARQRRPGERQPHERDPGASTTAQDEAEILTEVGAIPGDEHGGLVASEEKIREVGAVDAESVRENRRLSAIAGKKRANMAGVPFNTSDPLVIYETLLKVWPTNTLDIHVKRLTGAPVQQIIISRPRSGTELYEALKSVHGQYGEAEYEVKFLETSRKEYRGTGRITMPDTRPAPQQVQPMTYPPSYGAPPGYPPPAFASGGYMQPPQQATASAQPPQPPQQPPVVVQAPAGPDMGAMMASMQQMFEMFQAMQRQAAAQQQPPPPQAFAPPPQLPLMPPPPPPGSDMSAMMGWMKQAFDMFHSMQPQSPPSRGVEHQAQTPSPVAAMMGGMMGMPPAQPPPGTMWVPGFGFVPLDRLMQAVGGGGSGPGSGAGSGPHRGPYRPPYYPQGEPPPYPGPQPPPQPPPRQQTAAEQFREAMTVVRTAVDAVQEMNSLLPQQERQEAAAVPEADDDSPVKVIDTGPAKIVVNRSDGALRVWETGWANSDKIFKWVGEQHEKIQQANTARQLQQRQQQQLPPGYVEVGPGYSPPPGFVAIPVDSSTGQPLPPPPAQMPPPAQASPPPQRRTWDAPKIP